MNQQKERYYLYPREIVQWKMILANFKVDTESGAKHIAETLAICGVNHGIFNSDDFVCVNNGKLDTSKNNIYLISRNGRRQIWEIGEEVCDMDEYVIPNLYYVRQLGEVLS